MTVMIRATARAMSNPDGPTTATSTVRGHQLATGAAHATTPMTAASLTAPAMKSPRGSVMTRPSGGGARTACATSAPAATAGIASGSRDRTAIGSPNWIVTAAPARADIATGTTIAAPSPAGGQTKATITAGGGAN